MVAFYYALTAFFNSLTISIGTLKLDNSFKAGLSEWFLINEVPYVPGKNNNTLCRFSLNDDIGM